MEDKCNEAKEMCKQLQKEIDEKCVVTAWLKPLYDDLYVRLNQYANDCVKQMRDEGYKVEFMEAPTWVYKYINSANEWTSKKVTSNYVPISHITLNSLCGASELVSTWKEHITDKETQVLFLYIPIGAGALYDMPYTYMTAFGVLTLD